MKNPFMEAALALSLKSVRSGKGGPFGAVIARKGRIIARGFNQVTASNDPTAHAEVVAIRAACKRLKSFQLDDCELYTSCEPCPMCLAAIYWARLKRVHFAATRKDAANAGFDDDLIYREIPRPPARRRLPMKRVRIDGALAAFVAWKKSPNRIEY